MHAQLLNCRPMFCKCRAPRVAACLPVLLSCAVGAPPRPALLTAPLHCQRALQEAVEAAQREKSRLSYLQQKQERAQ